MENTKNLKWVSILYIALAVWMTAWISYKAAVTPRSETERALAASVDSSRAKPVSPDPGTIILRLNKEIQVKNKKFT